MLYFPIFLKKVGERREKKMEENFTCGIFELNLKYSNDFVRCSDEFSSFEYSRKKMREQLIFIRPLGRGRGATSAADHRGRFLSAPLAAATSYRVVEEGGKFQKQHAPVRAPAEMLPMQCAHAR